MWNTKTGWQMEWDMELAYKAPVRAFWGSFRIRMDRVPSLMGQVGLTAAQVTNHFNRLKAIFEQSY